MFKNVLYSLDANGVQYSSISCTNFVSLFVIMTGTQDDTKSGYAEATSEDTKAQISCSIV